MNARGAVAPGPLRDASGATIATGAVIGSGGEGVVTATTDPSRCVKVLHAPMAPGRAAKVAAMTALRDPALRAVAALPEALAHDPSGRPVGFVMPRVGGKDAHALYGPGSRKREFPRADWDFLAGVAAATASAFAEVHRAGFVVGDVNHSSVLVDVGGKVTLIDCDSWQATIGGRVATCDVGVETYTPPELQGRSFRGLVRTPDHDAFGLAVMAFQLLMLGRHPFAGRWSGTGEMPVGRAIAEGRFAYGPDAGRRGMAPPPGAPPLAVVGPRLAAMFGRAFDPSEAGRRPTAAEWAGALAGVRAGLVPCPRSAAHAHHPAAGDCPWCAVEAATGMVPFPLVAPVGDAAIDIEALLARVAALGALGPPAKPAEPAPAGPAPLPPLSALVPTAVAAAGSFGAAWTGHGIGAMVLGAIGVHAFARAARGAGRRTGPGEIEARVAHEEAKALHARRCGTADYDGRLRELAGLESEWRGMATRRDVAFARLSKRLRADQLRRHLECFPIRGAGIKGIGEGRLMVLLSNGIESAAEVGPRMSVPGIGEVLRERLLEWRASKARDFAFEEGAGVDPGDAVAVEAVLAAERRRLAEEIARVAEEAAASRARITSDRARLGPAVEAAARAVEAARKARR